LRGGGIPVHPRHDAPPSRPRRPWGGSNQRSEVCAPKHGVRSQQNDDAKPASLGHMIRGPKGANPGLYNEGGCDDGIRPETWTLLTTPFCYPKSVVSCKPGGREELAIRSVSASYVLASVTSRTQSLSLVVAARGRSHVKLFPHKGPLPPHRCVITFPTPAKHADRL